MLSSILRMPLPEGKCKRCMKRSSRPNDWRKGAPDNAKVVEEESRYNRVFLGSKGSTVITPTSIIKGVFCVEEPKGSVAVECNVWAFSQSNKVLG